MSALPTLYARTSLGQVQQWSIEVDGADYRTHEGIVDGAITTSKWTRCAGNRFARILHGFAGAQIGSDWQARDGRLPEPYPR